MTAPSIKEALERSIIAIDDWLNVYASELCRQDRVDEAIHRISDAGGTLAYIADVQQQNRASLATLSPPAGERREAIARLSDSIAAEVMRRRDKIITETNDEKRKPLMIEAADYVRNTLLASGLVQDEAVWRDISTAPKDGTKVDVWSEKNGRKADAQYNPDEYTFGVPWGWSSPWMGRITDVTHWMPLPTPPIRSARDGGAES